MLTGIGIRCICVFVVVTRQGADRHVTSRLGDTAQSLAMKKAYRKIVTLLEKKQATYATVRKSSPYNSE